MLKLNLKLLNSNVAIDSDKPVYTQSQIIFFIKVLVSMTT